MSAIIGTAQVGYNSTWSLCNDAHAAEGAEGSNLCPGVIERFNRSHSVFGVLATTDGKDELTVTFANSDHTGHRISIRARNILYSV